MSDIQTVIASIGALSDVGELEQAEAAVRARLKAARSLAAMQVRATLKPGDRVRVTGNISPKYLLGIEGTVVARVPRQRAGDVPVKLDDNFFAKRFSGQEIGIPAECVEAIS